MNKWFRALALPLGLSFVLVGCAAGDSPSSQPNEEVEQATVTIYAAASLSAVFDEAAEMFEAENENIDVLPIIYDGSSTLATQIIEGAPADVFASADERNMQTVTNEGLAPHATAFATNTLVVAVPAGNPGQIASLADLAEVTTVLCAPEVPCGGASERLLSNAGVEVSPASLEQNVTAVREKLSANEADAGLVYATDVVGDESIESFVPEGADEVVNVYPISTLDGAAFPEAAQLFVDYLLSDAGQALLAKYGFGTA
ncbi:MAG: molybdate ABC transporter substrate-binding protein [Leucobacter sp.]